MKERLAFVAPGAGAQEAGMGADFYNSREEIAHLFDYADKYLLEHGWDKQLTEVCFDGLPQLDETIYTQPATYVCSVAAFNVLTAEGVKPEIVTGHSTGMYAAYFAAGAINFENGLELVSARARIMTEISRQNPGIMAVVKASSEDLEEIIDQTKKESGSVYIGIINSHEQTVISGNYKEVGKFIIDELKSRGIGAIPVKVDVASHCPLMEAAVEPFSVVISKTTISKPAIQLILDTTAEIAQSNEEIRAEMANQLVTRVRWLETVQKMSDMGFCDFVEFGPGRQVLGRLIKKILPEAKTYQVKDEETLRQFLGARPELLSLRSGKN